MDIFGLNTPVWEFCVYFVFWAIASSKAFQVFDRSHYHAVEP